jgi:YjbE family integral membrane protein
MPGGGYFLNWFLLLGNVILLNIILSGDNALAISMAASRLPGAIRKKAIVIGSIISILALIVFVVVGSFIIELPFLKSIAGILLFWIAIHLVLEHSDSHVNDKSDTNHGAGGLWKAILMITIADLSMELDNALAMVSVADGRISVLMAGFLVTIPFLIFGSHFIARLMQKFSWIIYVAATYITWIAGSMIANDRAYASIPWHTETQWIMPAFAVTCFLVIMWVHGAKIKRQALLKNGQDTSSQEQKPVAL